MLRQLLMGSTGSKGFLHYTNEPRVVSQDEYQKLFERTALADADFNPDRFLPGTSGSTKLYRTLLDQTQVKE
jgi:hypothetical protein